MSTLAESIVSYTVGKIGDLAIQEVVFLCGVRGEVDSIKSELRTMQACLRDAAGKGKKGSEVAKNWVVDVQEAACDAEDAVEMFCLRIELKKRRKKLPKKFIYFFVDLYHLRKIGTRIKEVRTRISDIHGRRLAYEITEIGTGGEGQSSPRSKLLEYRKNAAFAEDDAVVGFETDANELATRLTTGDEDCRVVAIVAMGGAGKTTLAREVYRRPDVKDHFRGCVAWVCVSQCYNVKELLQEIAAQVNISISPQQFKQLNVKAIQERLSEFLLGQRYLIVLDDIWEHNAWDQLEAAFPKGRNGSRIMMTTRTRTVASRVGAEPYELPLLREEESQILFLKKAFPSKNDAVSCPEELRKIGEQIVAKCRGLPLAIEVIGGIIAGKNRTRQSWSSVLNSLPQQLSRDDEHCSDMLALSYEDLPHYLKRCFLYFGLFPEDENISAKKLIRLWVAEGFIERREQQTLEDVAEEYLEELISRSMIQAERRYDGSVRTCRIHDLLYNLAIQEGRQNCFLEIDRYLNGPTSRTVRRLAIHDRAECCDLLGCSVLNLRSLLCFTEANALKLPTGATKFLRVLDLEFASVPGERLFDAMGGLNLLKYLSLNRYGFRRIPPSIAKLYKLETLLFNYRVSAMDFYFARRATGLTEASGCADISEEIWTMSQLRHLVAPSCKLEGRPRFHRMKNLHTLFLTAGNWMETEEDSLSQLSSLRILKVDGNLNLQKGMLWNSIVKLVKIQSLVLKSSHELSANQFLLPPTMSLKEHAMLDRMTLKGKLQKLLLINEFPPNLTKLTLEDSRLEEDPMPTLEKLQNLQILKLREDAYIGRNMITSSQGFPQLRYFEVSRLRQLEGWTMEKGAMPMLVFSSIRDCRSLRMFPDCLGGKCMIFRQPNRSLPPLQHIPTGHVEM